MGCSKDLVEGDNTLLGCFTATTQLLQSPNVGSGIGPAIGAKADSIHTASLLRPLDGLLVLRLTKTKYEARHAVKNLKSRQFHRIIDCTLLIKSSLSLLSYLAYQIRTRSMSFRHKLPRY